MCVDSRAINKITIKYQYPIPRLEDLLDELHGATISLRLILEVANIKSVYLKEMSGKPPLKRKGGLYEWLVMPFALPMPQAPS